jgi:PAS domain S-box-containing protein
LDPQPANISDSKISAMMKSFATLISRLLEVEERHNETQMALQNERLAADLHRDATRILGAQSNYLRRLFEQAPGFTAVVRGPEHIYEIVNEAYYQLVGHRELIGYPIREALPELAGQGYYELLDQVYTTGEVFVGHEMKVAIQREGGGPITEIDIDLLFQPVIDHNGSVSGIFIQGYDITERKRAQDELRISNEVGKACPSGRFTCCTRGDTRLSGKSHILLCK